MDDYIKLLDHGNGKPPQSLNTPEKYTAKPLHAEVLKFNSNDYVNLTFLLIILLRISLYF